VSLLEHSDSRFDHSYMEIRECIKWYVLFFTCHIVFFCFLNVDFFHLLIASWSSIVCVFIMTKTVKILVILSVVCRIGITLLHDDMSSITMAADSTQSELMRRRKHKAKLARLSGKETRKQHVTGSSKSHKANSKQIKVSSCGPIFHYVVICCR